MWKNGTYNIYDAEKTITKKDAKYYLKSRKGLFPKESCF